MVFLAHLSRFFEFPLNYIIGKKSQAETACPKFGNKKPKSGKLLSHRTYLGLSVMFL